MLHFQGLESQWQPLCRKYRVESGKEMAQKVQTSEAGLSSPPMGSAWVDVITPPSDGDARGDN